MLKRSEARNNAFILLFECGKWATVYFGFFLALLELLLELSFARLNCWVGQEQ